MKCKAKFNPNDPPQHNRELCCQLSAGHKGWHEYATTMWADADSATPTPRPRQAK